MTTSFKEVPLHLRKRPCDANHCTQLVHPSKGMCPGHWWSLPKAMQQRIYTAARAYPTSAQRLSSVEFLEAWADAVEFVAKEEDRNTRNAYRNLANMLKAKQQGEAA